MSAHCFALYSTQSLSDKICNQVFHVRDYELWNRIVRVLRLQISEAVVLFDAFHSVKLTLDQETFKGKGFVVGHVIELVQCKPLDPVMNVCVGLLKKDAFEDALYSATVLGATSFIPILTKKIHRVWDYEKEQERLFKIMIAAAEQSKQFILPKLEKPLLLQDLLASSLCKSPDSACIVFDAAGADCFESIKKLTDEKPSGLTLFWGPEGGMDEEELEVLLQHGFSSVALTPSILRAQDAVLVGLGALRSCLK